MPYTFEGKRHFVELLEIFIIVNHIVNQIFKNDSIDRTKFLITYDGRRVKRNERDHLFHLNAYFDFENFIWKSGNFKIQEQSWAMPMTDTNEYKYPILGTIFFIICDPISC